MVPPVRGGGTKKRKKLFTKTAASAFGAASLVDPLDKMTACMVDPKRAVEHWEKIGVFCARVLQCDLV